MDTSRNKALTSFCVLLALMAAPADSIAQAKAALTRDISTAQPIDRYCQGFYSTGQQFAKCDLYTVPAGKRLVVEAVSYRVTLDAAISPTQILFGKGSTNSSNFLFSSKVRQITPDLVYNSGSTKTYAGSHMTRLYFEENELFAGIVYFTANGSNYVQEFNFTGYLVDK